MSLLNPVACLSAYCISLTWLTENLHRHLMFDHTLVIGETNLFFSLLGSVLHYPPNLNQHFVSDFGIKGAVALQYPENPSFKAFNEKHWQPACFLPARFQFALGM